MKEFSATNLQRLGEPLALEGMTRRKIGGGYWCGKGGSSSSSSTSNTTTTTAIDGRMVNDNGSLGINTTGSQNSSLNVNMIDSGTVSAATTMAQGAFDLADSLGTGALVTGGTLGLAGLDVGADAIRMGFQLASGVADGAADTVNNAAAVISAQGNRQSQDFQTLLAATAALGSTMTRTMESNTTLARDMVGASNRAFSDATAQANGSKNLVLAGLAVVGIAAVIAFEKRG